MGHIAKVIQTGRSQAVRLPAAYPKVIQTWNRATISVLETRIPER